MRAKQIIKFGMYNTINPLIKGLHETRYSKTIAANISYALSYQKIFLVNFMFLNRLNSLIK